MYTHTNVHTHTHTIDEWCYVGYMLLKWDTLLVHCEAWNKRKMPLMFLYIYRYVFVSYVLTL